MRQEVQFISLRKEHPVLEADISSDEENSVLQPTRPSALSRASGCQEITESQTVKDILIHESSAQKYAGSFNSVSKSSQVVINEYRKAIESDEDRKIEI